MSPKTRERLKRVLPENRRPTPPGEILEKEFLDPLEMSQSELAERMGVPRPRVNELIRGNRRLTAETALLLAEVFDTSPQFWMNIQDKVDLYDALHGESGEKLRDVRSI